MTMSFQELSQPDFPPGNGDCEKIPDAIAGLKIICSAQNSKNESKFIYFVNDIQIYHQDAGCG